MTPIPSVLDLTIQDNLESIFDTLKQAVIAHRDGYAISLNFSNIRPRGDIITSVQKPSEGAVAFLNIFDRALNTISSKTPKENPNIAILNVDHPDILEFLSFASHFTMKVGVTQAFIKAVESNDMYNLIDPRSGKATNELNARSVYDLISDKTSNGNDSGVLYLEESSPIEPSKKFDNQESLPFNKPTQAEEIVPPPVVTLA